MEKLGQHILPWMDLTSSEYLNPSLYVGLRLSSLQAGVKEDAYLHTLKLHYQQSLQGYQNPFLVSFSAFHEIEELCSD